MTFRSLSIVAAAIVSLLTPVEAASDAAPVTPDAMLAYRQYVKAQADTLVGMTRVLATEIKDGNLAAAQSAYAPAHRYLARIEPVARALRDLHARMDARADAFTAKEIDPRFAGFHKIEYGLFTNKSTAGLSAYADRLVKDARTLQGQIMLVDTSPSVLADAAARLVRAAGDDTLAGRSELYSKTDLWDFEANIDGARHIVDLLQSQAAAPDKKRLAETGVHFAKIDALLEKHKDGCGFKSFDEVGQDDRDALKIPVAAIAVQLAGLRGTFAMR